jgi:DNA repair protein RecO (recombination protein O)
VTVGDGSPSDLHHQRSFRVEAVVLRHADWGEADRMVTLFTLELGKVRAIAKGARRLRSRKAGHLEPLTRANLLLARGRDLLLVTQADTLEAFSPLRDDLLLATYAVYVVETLDRFTYEEGENRALYRLLVDSLTRLAQSSSHDTASLEGSHPEFVLRYYELRLLDLVGFRPQLFHCASCGKQIQPEDQFFSAALGGVICPDCGLKQSGSWKISLEALRYLRHFQRSSMAEASRARIPPMIMREMEALMQQYLTYLLERSLNTPAFLRRVRASQSGEQ